MNALICLALWTQVLVAAESKANSEAVVARTWAPSARPPVGHSLVARDDCGVAGRQPHIARGRSISMKGEMVRPFLRTAVTADTFWRSIVYRCRGLDAAAAYRLRLAFPPTYGQRTLLSVNGHFLGEPKLHHQIPACKGPCQHDGIHGREGAAGGKTDLLLVDPAENECRKFTLIYSRKSGDQSLTLPEIVPECIQDNLWIVTEDIGKVPLPEIDVTVSVHVRHPGAATFRIKEGKRCV